MRVWLQASALLVLLPRQKWGTRTMCVVLLPLLILAHFHLVSFCSVASEEGPVCPTFTGSHLYSPGRVSQCQPSDAQCQSDMAGRAVLCSGGCPVLPRVLAGTPGPALLMPAAPPWSSGITEPPVGEKSDLTEHWPKYRRNALTGARPRSTECNKGS